MVHAVRGMGGAGKTQVAAEYAYQHAGDYALTWWLDCEDAVLLGQQYAELAIRLGQRYPRRPARGDAPRGYQRPPVFTLCHLGNARWRLGRGQDTVSLLHEALVIAGEIGDDHGFAWASSYLGQVLWDSGAHEEACRHFLQAVDLFAGLGDPQAADVREILADLTRGKPGADIAVAG